MGNSCFSITYVAESTICFYEKEVVMALLNSLKLTPYEPTNRNNSFGLNKKAMFSRLGYHASFLPSFGSLEGVLRREGFVISDSFRLHFNISNILFPISKLLHLNIPSVISNSRALSIGRKIANRALSLPFQAVGRQDQILILAKRIR